LSVGKAGGEERLEMDVPMLEYLPPWWIASQAGRLVIVGSIFVRALPGSTMLAYDASNSSMCYRLGVRTSAKHARG
jgi:hypothetical protein